MEPNLRIIKRLTSAKQTQTCAADINQKFRIFRMGSKKSRNVVCKLLQRETGGFRNTRIHDDNEIYKSLITGPGSRSFVELMKNTQVISSSEAVYSNYKLVNDHGRTAYDLAPFTVKITRGFSSGKDERVLFCFYCPGYHLCSGDVPANDNDYTPSFLMLNNHNMVYRVRLDTGVIVQTFYLGITGQNYTAEQGGKPKFDGMRWIVPNKRFLFESTKGTHRDNVINCYVVMELYPLKFIAKFQLTRQVFRVDDVYINNDSINREDDLMVVTCLATHSIDVINFSKMINDNLITGYRTEMYVECPKLKGCVGRRPVGLPFNVVIKKRPESLQTIKTHVLALLVDDRLPFLRCSNLSKSWTSFIHYYEASTTDFGRAIGMEDTLAAEANLQLKDDIGYLGDGSGRIKIFNWNRFDVYRPIVQGRNSYALHLYSISRKQIMVRALKVRPKDEVNLRKKYILKKLYFVTYDYDCSTDTIAVLVRCPLHPTYEEEDGFESFIGLFDAKSGSYLNGFNFEGRTMLTENDQGVINSEDPLHEIFLDRHLLIYRQEYDNGACGVHVFTSRESSLDGYEIEAGPHRAFAGNKLKTGTVRQENW